MSKVTVRTCFQPTQLLEVKEHEAKVLAHQGLLWDGTREELAAHYAAAGLDMPPEPPAAQQTTAAPSTGAQAGQKKEA